MRETERITSVNMYTVMTGQCSTIILSADKNFKYLKETLERINVIEKKKSGKLNTMY